MYRDRGVIQSNDVNNGAGRLTLEIRRTGGALEHVHGIAQPRQDEFRITLSSIRPENLFKRRDTASAHRTRDLCWRRQALQAFPWIRCRVHQDRRVDVAQGDDDGRLQLSFATRFQRLGRVDPDRVDRTQIRDAYAFGADWLKRHMAT